MSAPELLTPEPAPNTAVVHHLGVALDQARLIAEVDDNGEWLLSITTPHPPGRPDGRRSSTTFWRPRDHPCQGDPTLSEILDTLVEQAARKADTQ